MRQIVVLPSFERSVRRLDAGQKKFLGRALEKFNYYAQTGVVSSGLGFKKINHNKYEFRVDIRLRVIVKAEGSIFYLVLVEYMLITFNV